MAGALFSHKYSLKQKNLFILFLQLFDLLQAPLHGGLAGLDLDIRVGAFQVFAGSVFSEEVEGPEPH